ncbi:MAG: hypothetical protein ACREL5_04055 [Gemmatimonadales bacterium]
MIVFLTPRESMYTIEGTLQRPEYVALQSRFRVVAWEAFFERPELPAGSCVFTALDQLTPTGRDVAARCRDLMLQAAPGARMLNDPLKTLRRFDLLRAAFDSGQNRFRVSRATAAPGRHRYPVFVRCEHEHSGSLTPPLHSPTALRRALAIAVLRGYHLRDLLVVEHVDAASPDGVYRKYAAYSVGDRVIPRCVEVSPSWVTKDDDRIITEATMQEDRSYVTANPHRKWLSDIFRMANVGYGRADYGIVDGTPQLWEINLAPTIGAGPPTRIRHTNRTAEQREMLTPMREYFHRHFEAAFEAIDHEPDPAATVTVPISPAERAALRRESRALQRIRARDTAVSRLVRPSLRLLRTMTRALRPRSGP